jgi:hypothetical protein
MSIILSIFLFTPWCRILFEKPNVTQPVKKYPAFLWDPKVHHRVHKNPPLDPILSQLNLVRPIDPTLPKDHLNVILPPTPMYSLPVSKNISLLGYIEQGIPNTFETCTFVKQSLDILIISQIKLWIMSEHKDTSSVQTAQIEAQFS